MAEHCEFGTQRDEQIRDRIVIEILDKSLSHKLQMRSDLDLYIVIQMARQSELNLLKDQEGMAAIQDDIIVFGRSVAEHDTGLQHVFEAIEA